MKSVFFTAQVLLAFVLGVSGVASAELDWSDLPDPAAQAFEDPFQKLNYEQLTDVRRVALLDERLSSGNVDEATRPSLENQRSDMVLALAEQGIDANSLLARRWEIADKRARSFRAVNPAIVGAEVTMLGFAFPGPPTKEGQPTAYLVPEIGMCSHYPPPPPNKLVRIVLREDQTVSGFYVPVEVKGLLETSESKTEVFIMDGPRVLDSAITIVAESVELIAPKLRGRAASVQNTGSRVGITKALESARSRLNK